MPTVSVIATILNEASSLPGLLASLEGQTLLPDEVVIVDGGSSDGTWELLQAYRGKLSLQAQQLIGCTIAQGRNAAITLAQGEIIAVTDAGVRLSPQWLAELMRPFEQVPGTQAVAGFFEASPQSVFELALGATTLPAIEDVRPEQFLPSSRSVAFSKEVWQQAGGYPEWLDYCEDLVFDLRLQELGVRFAWSPGAVVYFRPRSSLSAFFRQYYLYARGDGKANLWLKRHLIRYAAYLFALAALVSGAVPLVGLLAVGGAGYAYRPTRRLFELSGDWGFGDRIAAIMLVPVIRLVGDVAKMVGYPVGVWWRWTLGSRQ